MGGEGGGVVCPWVRPLLSLVIALTLVDLTLLLLCFPLCLLGLRHLAIAALASLSPLPPSRAGDYSVTHGSSGIPAS